MDHIYNMFHISLLQKYISDLTYMFNVRDIELEDALVYKKHPT